MIDFEIEKATVEVEKSQAELQRALDDVEVSLKTTTLKVSRMIQDIKKYPGLFWGVAGAIGTMAALDFISHYGRPVRKEIDS